MKFLNKVPSEHGYYWYIDLEYPVPVIGFSQGGNFYDRHNHPSENNIGKHLLIGDKIEQPTCRDVEYENDIKPR